MSAPRIRHAVTRLCGLWPTAWRRIPVTDETKKPAAKRSAKPKRKTRSIGRPAKKRRIGKTFLIDKTVDLLRTTPPEKLSLSMAARHAGVHLTLFKYYFNDRTRLLVDVARTMATALGDRVASVESDDLPAPQRFRIRIDTMVDFFFTNPYYHRLMVEIIAAESDPLATELINLWITMTLDIYRDIIQAGVDEGTLRPIDPYFTFVAMMGLCEQYHHASRLVDLHQSGEDDTSARYKAYVYDLLIHGIGADPAKQGKNALPA